MSLLFHKTPLLLTIWKIIATALSVLLPLYLQHRCKKNKEIKARLSERMGYSILPRPTGSLIHFHAASVGEVISIFPIIMDIHQYDSNQNFLITTGTVTSFHIVQQQFGNHPTISNHIQHQFIPLDVPQWVNRFVSYWQPNLSVIVESELWPNLITSLHKHHVPLALINARLSNHSFKTWHRFHKTAQFLLSQFQWISARSVQDLHNFQKLGVDADFYGDIKQFAPELPYNPQTLHNLHEKFKDHPIWLAASTHQGEEQIIAQAHHQLRRQYPNLITIIVPRHPERNQEIIKQIGDVPLRSLKQFPDHPSTNPGIWLCDTLGELGLFYRLCDVVFIGNSLNTTSKGGGHNPFEPAKLHCAIASGNKIDNFKQAYRLFGHAITIISSPDELTYWVDDMLCHSQKRQEKADQALQIMKQQDELLHDISIKLYHLKSNHLC